MRLYITLVLCIIITGCNWYGDSPGEGKAAEKFYKKSEPIIDALKKYYADNGEYPDKLASLVPMYLSKNFDQQLFLYNGYQDSYELSFSYEGPGVNSCVYAPTKGWKCSGLI